MKRIIWITMFLIMGFGTSAMAQMKVEIGQLVDGPAERGSTSAERERQPNPFPEDAHIFIQYYQAPSLKGPIPRLRILVKSDFGKSRAYPINISPEELQIWAVSSNPNNPGPYEEALVIGGRERGEFYIKLSDKDMSSSDSASKVAAMSYEIRRMIEKLKNAEKRHDLVTNVKNPVTISIKNTDEGVEAKMTPDLKDIQDDAAALLGRDKKQLGEGSLKKKIDEMIEDGKRKQRNPSIDEQRSTEGTKAVDEGK